MYMVLVRVLVTLPADWARVRVREPGRARHTVDVVQRAFLIQLVVLEV